MRCELRPTDAAPVVLGFNYEAVRVEVGQLEPIRS